jgi:hypothetical protein
MRELFGLKHRSNWSRPLAVSDCPYSNEFEFAKSRLRYTWVGSDSFATVRNLVVNR